MRRIIFAFLLFGCMTEANKTDLPGLQSINSDYEIAFWVRDTDSAAPIHIYIEGDGHAFDGRARPTSDPTPHSALVRNMALRDASPNVAYIARPCQFIMSPACSVTDWTTGRFSEKIVTEMSDAVRWVARGRPIVLIGYSGGALISGLIIAKNPDLDVRQWITVAGVLNHADWTKYLGDTPLTDSLDLNELPRVSARHYVAPNDSIVPNTLSAKWVGAEKLIIVPGATHSKFPNFNIDLSIDKI